MTDHLGTFGEASIMVNASADVAGQILRRDTLAYRGISLGGLRARPPRCRGDHRLRSGKTGQQGRYRLSSASYLRLPPLFFGGEAAQVRPMRKHQTRLDDSVARLLPKGFRGFRRLSTSLVGHPTPLARVPLGRACCGGSSGAHPAQGARAGADRLSSAAPAVSLRVSPW